MEITKEEAEDFRLVSNATWHAQWILERGFHWHYLVHIHDEQESALAEQLVAEFLGYA